MRNIEKYANNKGYGYKVVEELKGRYGYTVVEITTDKTIYKVTHFKGDTMPYSVKVIEDGWEVKDFYSKTQKEICERMLGMEFLKNQKEDK